MILGLDISTSITGASILDDDGRLVYCEAWRTDRKDLNFYQKLNILKDQINEIVLHYWIHAIYVEEPLNMFAGGKSSAQTISKIQRFNGAVCWMLKEIYDKEPVCINASTARKLCGIKISRGKKAKEIVLEHMLQDEDTFSINYTRHGNPSKGEYDRADSIVVARAGYYLWNEEQKNEQIS